LRSKVFSFFLLFFCGLLPIDGLVHARSKNLEKAVENIQSNAPKQIDYFNAGQAALDQKSEEEHTGSLWVSSYSSHLYDNMYRASRPGDSVMIVVDENAKGTNKGDTKANRQLDHTATIDQLGGLINKITSVISGFNPSNLIQAHTQSKFTGLGETNRQGTLAARITATVTQVLKNGNMVIRGEQHLKINKEEQLLVVEGIIRPYDINPDNTVLSSAIADARISFTGFGVVGEKQSPGWLVRVLDHVWPF